MVPPFFLEVIEEGEDVVDGGEGENLCPTDTSQRVLLSLFCHQFGELYVI